MFEAGQAAQQVLQEIAWIILFRGAPFVLWGIAQARTRPKAMLAGAGLYAASAAVAGLLAEGSVAKALAEAALVHGYMLLLVPLVYRLQKLFTSERLTRVAAAATCVALYGILGRYVYPTGAGLAVTILGWERMLGAYSYIVDGPRDDRRSMTDCVFFLAVSPMLVYPERGAPVAARAPHRQLIPRALVALSLLSLHVALAHAIDDVAAWRSLAASGAPTTTAVSVLYLMVWGISVYALQAGIAALSIGWMRLLGWSIPERYVVPYLARSPVELWQRWNTYFGSWIRRYVFYPLTRHLMRARKLPFPAARAAALCLSFTAVGILHDASLYAQHARFAAPVMTALFAAHALWIIAWQLATTRSTAAPAAANTLRSKVFGVLALQPVIVLTELVALPVLAGEGVVLNLKAVLWP